MTALFDPLMIARPFGRYALCANENDVPHVSGVWDEDEAREIFNNFASRYKVTHEDGGTYRLHIRQRPTGALLADLTVDAASHVIDLIQDDHLAHLDNRGVGDELAEHQRYTTRGEAIRSEIIEPIEASEESAGAYDLGAIAERVLATHAAGYACIVDEDYFWRVVEEHVKTPESAATDAGANDETAEGSTDDQLTPPVVAVAHLEQAGKSTGVEYVLHDNQRVPRTGEYVQVLVRRDALVAGIRDSLVFRACPCCVENHDNRVRERQHRQRVEREVRAEVAKRMEAGQ